MYVACSRIFNTPRRLVLFVGICVSRRVVRFRRGELGFIAQIRNGLLLLMLLMSLPLLLVVVLGRWCTSN